MVCAEESPCLHDCTTTLQKIPAGEIDAPTPARIGTCRPMGRSHFSFDGERKVCKRKPAARRLQRRPTSLCAVGFGLREPSGLSSATGCPVSQISLPVALLASHPPCGSLWAAPKAPLGPRFPSGQFASLTRRKKALYCPFLKEGVRNVARRIVGEITPAFVRARAHSFPLSKRARLFPSAAYRRSAPPQAA